MFMKHSADNKNVHSKCFSFPEVKKQMFWQPCDKRQTPPYSPRLFPLPIFTHNAMPVRDADSLCWTGVGITISHPLSHILAGPPSCPPSKTVTWPRVLHMPYNDLPLSRNPQSFSFYCDIWITVSRNSTNWLWTPLLCSPEDLRFATLLLPAHNLLSKTLRSSKCVPLICEEKGRTVVRPSRWWLLFSLL